MTYSQINTSIPTMIDIPWPPEFVNFVAIFNVVNIDIFSLVGVSRNEFATSSSSFILRTSSQKTAGEAAPAPRAPDFY